MPPLTQRKRLTNEEKLNIIEDSKKPGFCRKKTQVTFSESWGHIRNYSCLLLSKYVRSSSPSFSRNSGSLVIVDIFQLTEQSTITREHCTYRIRANRTSLLIRTPGDTFWAHYGQFWQKIGQKHDNFRRFFAEIDHSAGPKNPKF